MLFIMVREIIWKWNNTNQTWCWCCSCSCFWFCSPLEPLFVVDGSYINQRETLFLKGCSEKGKLNWASHLFIAIFMQLTHLFYFEITPFSLYPVACLGCVFCIVSFLHFILSTMYWDLQNSSVDVFVVFVISIFFGKVMLC